jgi:hypothetical protein
VSASLPVKVSNKVSAETGFNGSAEEQYATVNLSIRCQTAVAPVPEVETATTDRPSRF